MALAHEGNTDLAFDTDVLKNCGQRYGDIADDLDEMAEKLTQLLTDLKETGWTTRAGSAFQKMADTNWKKNIEKYSSLLRTLKSIMDESAGEYDNLVTGHIEKTKL